MTLLGLVGLADPPRPEAAEAIATARSAGVDVKMITGDHPVTATAIAAELGIVGRSVRGADLGAMSDAELVDSVEEIGVFARVSPNTSSASCALQARGRITAMTGDGVNDAPSLKQADVGVAMGITGTEVARNPPTWCWPTTTRHDRAGDRARPGDLRQHRHVRPVPGRDEHGAIFTLVGSQPGLPKPMSAIQLLWVNIIMDGPPAMALGVDPPRTGVMDRPPRSPRRPILDGPTLRTLVVHGATMATVALSILAWAEPRHGRGVATTMAFTTFVLMQVVNALNVRSTRTVFTPAQRPPVVGARCRGGAAGPGGGVVVAANALRDGRPRPRAMGDRGAGPLCSASSTRRGDGFSAR
jgi:Ca2+-transporting ATPase